MAAEKRAPELPESERSRKRRRKQKHPDNFLARHRDPPSIPSDNLQNNKVSPITGTSEALNSREALPQQTLRTGEIQLEEKKKQKRKSRSKNLKKKQKSSEKQEKDERDHPQEPQNGDQQGESPDEPWADGSLEQKSGDVAKTKNKRKAKRKEKRERRMLQSLRDDLPPAKNSPLRSNEGDLHNEIVQDLKSAEREADPKRLISQNPSLTPTIPSFDAWMESTTTGGYFLRKDPAMTQDGQHLLLADRSSLYVYSVQTSLLIRSLNIDEDEMISDFLLSSTQPNVVFLACETGSISKWNWIDGHKISKWNTRKGLVKIHQNMWEETLKVDELTCVFYSGKSGYTDVVAFKLPSQGKGPSSESQLLHRRVNLVLHECRTGTLPLVLFSTTSILFGLPEPSTDQYIWREIAVTEDICSLDIYQPSDAAANSQKWNKTIDLAVGCKSGLILVYEDILKILFNREKNESPDQRRAMNPRRLHWHRTGVETVKYSHDGNYLISGGHETVLVIWQLSTDRRQYLPHLSSPILNLSVSPSGNSYALLQADNSVMVLSTSTLEPISSISGLGLPFLTGDSSPALPTLMALDPLHPTYLLNASSPCLSSPSSSLTFLQTYSLSTSPHHISRQALTRNSTTNLQTAPHGQKVNDPSLTHLQLTNNGSWLVTVEEWSPDAQSLDALFPKDQQYDQARRRSRETALRVWARSNEASSDWEVNTRLDDPHFGSILAMSMNPTKNEFATVGEDGKIKLWTPKVRRRDGQNIQDREGNVLYAWSCRLSIELEGSDTLSASSDTAQTAALAYSDDGSTLAIYLANEMSPLTADSQSRPPSPPHSQPVSILSSRTGALVQTLPHLLVSPSTHTPKLAFVSRHLIALSSHLRVWDLVSSTLIFGLALPATPNNPSQSPNPSPSPSAFTHLASHPSGSTFAIAFPLLPKKRHQKPSSKVAVFNPEGPSPLFESTVQGRVTALVPIPGGAGYVYADGQGRVKTIKAPGYGALTAGRITGHSGPAEGGLKNGLENMFGSLVGQRAAIEEESQGRLAIEDGPAGPSRSETALTRALDTESWGTMPVRDLFEKVASVYARKPVATA